MKRDLPKTYLPQEVESGIYRRWEQSGFFNPDNLPGERTTPFTISLPPPNATGQLHLGHAIMLAIQDAFIRFARMRGKRALWLPGTDHAAIATESLVIRNLQKEGIKDPRNELGREELVKRIAEFVEESRATIRSQIRMMGSSCDWSRERYTLDPALNRMVTEVFVKMYHDGLIYRGDRIVNWDPRMQTTVADDELEWSEEKTKFYYFQFGPFVIGTARPETKFGDKYVVMHPDDERYARYKHGETFTCEWINGPITATIIKDKAVDPSFGTGVMTITPWHDATDFEIAERHGLEKEQIIDFSGKLLPVAGEFAGMPIDEARPKIVEKMKQKGLLVKVDEEYVHRIARSYRGKGVIEPQIKKQWFINVNKRVVSWKGSRMSLKEIMQDVIRAGDISIIPQRFEKVYFHWIDNLRDWCISRQIWWGHRIPAWYRNGEEEIFVGSAEPEGEGWKQDPDTLDTWFSSALWTWSTLVDEKKAHDPTLSFEEILAQSPDIARFHPTDLMETGYDILFFWVARMILMTTYAVGEIPFRTVYLHGLVRTRDGKKMSKSDPETMIDPLDVIAQYGADALRLSMMVGQTPGNDTRLYKEKIAGYRNFVNKLWNIGRFILSSLDDDVPAGTPQPTTPADEWILSRLESVKHEVSEHMEQWRISPAIQTLYDFTWGDVADWYIEIAKLQLRTEDTAPTTRRMLRFILENIVTLWHPFAPYVTEHIYSLLIQSADSNNLLMIRQWPASIPVFKNETSERAFASLQELIVSLRNIRAELGISPSTPLRVYIQGRGPLPSFQQTLVTALARTSLENKAPQSGIRFHSAGYTILLSEEDGTALKKKRDQERARLEAYIANLERKLSNDSFLNKAPQEIVAKEQAKLADARKRLNELSG